MNLVGLTDLTPFDIREIWRLAKSPPQAMRGTVGWSFEGNGIRTRTTFLQAFRDLGLSYSELPNLLKTGERARDLAGYLDPFYSIYVIRESNHQRLLDFASASRRPVVNAMSGEGHPCEVLTDAFYVDSTFGPLENTRICLWGPTTNVFKSWHELAAVFGFEIFHLCETSFHETKSHVLYRDVPDVEVDVLVTDGWPANYSNSDWSLTAEKLARLGNPRLLPTPPFSIGKEICFDPTSYARFVGYTQKELLLPVQRGILTHVGG